MKACRKIFILSALLVMLTTAVSAQCSICTRTAQQLGERPARALNAGVLYLAAAPLMIAGFIGYRWWKKESPSIKKQEILPQNGEG